MEFLNLKTGLSVCIAACIAVIVCAANYPPYSFYAYGPDETDDPPLYYTKVCEPGRSAEKDATYVVLGTPLPKTSMGISPSYQGALVVPETIDGLPVRRIGNGAFLNCSRLTSVSLPSTLREIGENAFGWCTSLTNVTFAEGTSHIGRNAFSNCVSLAAITLPASLARIEENVFVRCESLTNVTFLGNAPRLSARTAGLEDIPYLGQANASVSGQIERFKVHIYSDTFGWVAPYTAGVPEKWPIEHGYLQAYETVVEKRSRKKGLALSVVHSD